MTFRHRMREALQIVGGFVHRPGQSLRLLRALPITLRALQFSESVADADGSRSFSPARDEAGVVQLNPLQAYFNAHVEGRGIWKCNHYFDIYHRHFSKFVGAEVHVLEVGVYSGGSLQMWKEYFGPQCHIYGVDSYPGCKDYEDQTTRIFIGDQSDRAFWASVKQAVPQIDILIDDGGHYPEQQIITLEEVLPHLRPGGVYVCEDVQGTMNVFSSYVHGLALHLNTVTATSEPNRFPTTPFQSAVHSIHTYPWVTVIEKTARPTAEFCASKRGSEWQYRSDWQ